MEKNARDQQGPRERRSLWARFEIGLFFGYILVVIAYTLWYAPFFEGLRQATMILVHGGSPVVAQSSEEAAILTLPFYLPAAGPLRVSSENPRYFMDGEGNEVYLTGSHTWSSLLDNGNGSPPAAFDYAEYLDFLEGNGHNFFRLWTWEQSRWTVETNDNDYWFNPETAYVRTGPGEALDGKAKWDLTKLDQGYFDRLRERVVMAGERGMYVAVMLFDGWSVASAKGGFGANNPWRGHPYNGSNNINGVEGDTNGDNSGEEVHELGNEEVLGYQEAYVRKVIDTLNDLDNVLWEVSNESHDGATAWQNHMVSYIKEYERTKGKQHPVGMTSEWPGGDNGELYASEADWVSLNGDINNPPAADGRKVVLADSDHLCGVCGDRSWVWKSFTRGENPIFMDGYDGAGYGVGGEGFVFDDPVWVSLRANLGYTRQYAQRMKLGAMVPRGDLSSTEYALANAAETGGEYLVYAPYGGSFTVNLGGTPGTLSVEWLNPATGGVTAAGTVSGGAVRSFTPPFGGDAVLYLVSPPLISGPQ